MEPQTKLKSTVKKAIENYQCPGCMTGHDTSCFESNRSGVGCGKHCAGTFMMPHIGKIFLGLPKGFNRLGEYGTMKPIIFESFDQKEGWNYETFNIPVWKYLNKDGHTLVRGIMPRKNEPFLHIFLEDCIDKINCMEITEKQISEMD